MPQLRQGRVKFYFLFLRALQPGTGVTRLRWAATRIPPPPPAPAPRLTAPRVCALKCDENALGRAQVMEANTADGMAISDTNADTMLPNNDEELPMGA